MNESDLLDPQSTNTNNGNLRTLPYSTAVLVLGICSLVGCIFYGIPGLVCGIIAIVLHKKDKAIYDTNPAAYEFAFKNSKAGNICAIIGTIMSSIFLLIFIVYIVFIVSIIGSMPIR